RSTTSDWGRRPRAAHGHGSAAGARSGLGGALAPTRGVKPAQPRRRGVPADGAVCSPLPLSGTAQLDLGHVKPQRQGLESLGLAGLDGLNLNVDRALPGRVPHQAPWLALVVRN